MLNRISLHVKEKRRFKITLAACKQLPSLGSKFYKCIHDRNRSDRGSTLTDMSGIYDDEDWR